MCADHVLLGSLVSMKSEIDHWKAFAHAALCCWSPSFGKRKRTLRKAIACEESAEVRHPGQNAVWRGALPAFPRAFHTVRLDPRIGSVLLLSLRRARQLHQKSLARFESIFFFAST
jgi:hypothetical protein